MIHGTKWRQIPQKQLCLLGHGHCQQNHEPGMKIPLTIWGLKQLSGPHICTSLKCAVKNCTVPREAFLFSPLVTLKLDTKEFIKRQNQEPGTVGESGSQRAETSRNKPFRLGQTTSELPAWQDRRIAGSQDPRVCGVWLYPSAVCLGICIALSLSLYQPWVDGCVGMRCMGRRFALEFRVWWTTRSHIWTDGRDSAYSRKAGLWVGCWG